MALSYNANVKAALDAALPGQKLTDADYHWWTNNGGVAAVQNTWGASAPAPAPATGSGNNGFSVGGQTSTSNAQSVYTPLKPVSSNGYKVSEQAAADPANALRGVYNKAPTPNMNDPRVASFWGNVNPAKADGTNALGGNMSQGVVQSLGFKTAQEFLDWQAENERKAALGDPNGFVTGGGRSGTASPSPAPGAGAGAGSGAGGTGSGLIGGDGSSTQTTLTPGMSVEERAARIAATDSPLMQQARGRAMQQMNERGLINSSLGIQAGQEAVLDRATDIAKADAQTEFQNSQNNANRGLQWKTAQLQAETSMKNAQLSAGTQLSVAEINRQYSQMANLSSTAASLMTAFNNDVNQIVLSDLPAEAKEAAINARTQTLRMSLNVMGSINGDVDMNNLLNGILG